MVSKYQVQETEQDGAPGRTVARWFATFTSNLPVDLPGYMGQVIGTSGRSQTLYLGNEINGVPPLCAAQESCSVIFDGALFNQEDLRDELGDFLSPAAGNEAELILKAYWRWGEDLLKRLRGSFALIIWDGAREVLLCLRDPLGSHPLFYAQSRNDLLLSPSIEELLQQPHVSRALNRSALVDHFLDRYPRLEETCYEAVSRVPPGHVLRVAGGERRSFRYWDPAPDGKVQWLTPEEVEGFDELLDRAVSRCLNFGPAGIFLSGGLDSVTVAAVATELCRTNGLRKPWALSLIFPDPLSNEEVVQRGVATQLGLPQVVKPFFEATGTNGLLGPALALSSSLSCPLMNTWLPAYYQLALEGKKRGCRTILTGGGGDEWLGLSPLLAADLLRDFDFVSLYKLWQSMRRSLRRSSVALGWNLLWKFGAQQLVMPPAHKFLKETAPWALKLRRRLSPRPAPWEAPKWLAPGTELRAEFNRRREEEHLNKLESSDSHYIQDIRPALDHPVVSRELEEMFEVYQKAGVRMLQPFCDTDLVDMLYRTPPFLLIQDGRSKGLVRSSMARRFPNLGFGQQRKVEATSFYASLIYKDGRNIWEQLQGAKALSDLGIVDDAVLNTTIDTLLARRRDGSAAHRVWSTLNLETWARTHIS
ncbi:MAG TPA: asparagine synthase-related protein [Pyrinomonadaceae bacterium]|nr:asparagine synthase-related protein [Pyrinomonadaceae bacterium]